MSSDDAPDERELRKVTDARTLRALAHPVRVALFEQLAMGGAMTATELGERIGESATTCSFHLRQLAKYGFVEDAGGGAGRSRPWRLTSIGMTISPGGDPEAQIASDAVVRMFRERQFARYDDWRASKGAYPRPFQEAAINSQYLFYLTAAELEQLGGELHELLARWVSLDNRLEDPSRRPAGSAPVETLLLAHPVALPTPENDPGDA